MQKTAKEIQGALYGALRLSAVAEEMSGEVYHSGTRPRDSRLEDAVVRFVAGIGGQLQQGTLCVTLHVADTDPWQNGVTVEDMERTALFERLLTDWAMGLGIRDGILWELRETPQTYPDEARGEHFVSLRLSYRLVN